MASIRTVASTASIPAALAAAMTAVGTTFPLRTTTLLAGLDRPVGLAAAPGDPGRLYLIEKKGVIRVFDAEAGVLLAAPFLDIDSLVKGGDSEGDERGLLGLCFAPDYATSGAFYVNYTGEAGAGDTFVQRYTALDPFTADPASALAVITFDQPFANHNGGWIGFSPLDGLLYVASGDGGASGDVLNAGQDIVDQPLGKVLRLDVGGDDFPDDPQRNYRIPPDNPFVGVEGDDEIWCYGLRNPWRCAFDRATGDLWIGDVGQNYHEEIDLAPAGVGALNFGWRCMEGAFCTGIPGCTCMAPELADPIVSYPHEPAGGICVIGGHVYRGCAIPEADGTYFFADYGTDRFWSVRAVDGAASDLTVQTASFSPSLEGDALEGIVSFGEDLDGELYVIAQGSAAFAGRLFKVVRDPAAPPSPPCSEFDLNGDGAVDAADLGALLALWGACPKGRGCTGDFDGDGGVGSGDLGLLLGAL